MIASELRKITDSKISKHEDNVTPIVGDIIDSARKIAETGHDKFTSLPYALNPDEAKLVVDHLNREGFKVKEGHSLLPTGYHYVFTISW